MEAYKIRTRLQELLEAFDKDYIKECFEEGIKMKVFGGKLVQNYQYVHEGWIYTISRQPNIQMPEFRSVIGS
ncbi:MAG: hypothetical protein OEL89_00205 [Candidatus Peregrinibacteria bacterium]|nr:hypothetical protein [Candidatus Peregrinibacteria bacterium]